MVKEEVDGADVDEDAVAVDEAVAVEGFRASTFCVSGST